MNEADRKLGMDRTITRRDFLNGTRIAIGAAMLSGNIPGLDTTANAAASQMSSAYYPPTLTGMRGSHDGSFEVAHEMRTGKTWENPEDTQEVYDLIVVGGGLSGLSAAYYFRKEMPKAKILILDNHDDFGGHAKRNEFEVDGKQVIGYGGTMYIAGTYAEAGLSLLEDIGVDPASYRRAEKSETAYDELNLRGSIFYDRETFGEDKLIRGWDLEDAPLSPAAKKDLERLWNDRRDYFPELTQEEKIVRLRSMSYTDYLLNIVKVDKDVILYYQYDSDSNGVGCIDTLSAWAAFRQGFYGFDGLGLSRPRDGGFGKGRNPMEGLHFPDGNAGVARLIVRKLIPKALPGTTMEDSVTTRVRYEEIDKPTNSTRIRLNSTVVNVDHVGERSRAKEVKVTYVQDNKAYTAHGKVCVMACYNSMIPYLCPQLPETQKEALHLAVRKPYVYTNVVLRNWKPFVELGIQSISSPGGFYQSIELDWGVSLGDYKAPKSPNDPMVLHLQQVPVRPGPSARDQFRLGRLELLNTSFETFERKTRDQLARALAGSSFDPARDITAITINRWPHGYAGGSNELFDPEWSYDEVPWVVGRKRFGRIAIANSDAAAVSLTAAAFDQGHRAVQELIRDVIRPDFQYPWAEGN